MISTRHQVAAWMLAFLGIAGTEGFLQAADKKPNVLLIVTDDVGWAEYGFQGARDIPTPNIDSLAANGVKFTQGYVSGPYCSPTRAGLLSGRYQTRFGHEFNSTAAQSGLKLSEKTIAERLKPLGYATAAIGKWHLGSKEEFRPYNRGFDHFFGTLANTPYFHPSQFVDTSVSKEVAPVTDDEFYTTDAYGDQAVSWLDAHQDEPWFLYVPFNAQHGPLQAPQKYLDRFKDIKDEKRQTFAAIMSATDDAIGKILGKIRDLQQEENTLVIFHSDNGGPTNQTSSSNLPLRGYKATTWEGGVRVPFAIQWKGTIPAGQVYENPVIQLDVLPTVLAAAGGEIDPAWKLDGVDLLPFLKEPRPAGPHESLFWRFGDQWAVRHGDWKLVVANGGSGEPELYNLTGDISEAKNLASEEPAKVAELQKLYDTWNAEQAPPSAGKEQGNRKKNQGKPGNGKGKGKYNKAAAQF